MTTAHRPTWTAAVAAPGTRGNFAAGSLASQQRSAKDATAHTKLKFRQTGHYSVKDLERRDLRETLAQWEAEARRKKELAASAAGGSAAVAAAAAAPDDGPALLLTQHGEVDEQKLKKYDDADDSDSGGSDLDSDGSGSGEESEDDEAALQRELDIIRREREEARKKEAAAEAEKAAKAAREAALSGNALLVPSASASAQVKRRWNDDVVFKNQARGAPVVKKRFVNDTIRNDFHRRFLSKYVL